MAKQKDPVTQLAWVLHLTALNTGAFMGQLLLLAVPALSPHRLWVMLGTMLLAWLAYFLWLKYKPEEPLPARFSGFAVGAAFGTVLVFSIQLLKLLFEPLIDLTAYESIIHTVRLACPVFCGIIGALTYKSNKNEEENNNG